MQFCFCLARTLAQHGRVLLRTLPALMQGLLLSVAVAGMVLTPGWHGALANPAGGTVVAGDARIEAAGNRLTVTNTPGTVINWQGFSIGAHELTEFVQQHADSAILNRVIGPNLSDLQGALRSNGRVFLINPNGIAVGADAVIDTNGFVGSTLGMSDEDFRAGRLTFQGEADAGSIDTAGLILAHAGDVLLVAPRIHNSGLIQTDDGSILLAAGHAVTVADVSLTGVSFEIQAPDDTVVNLGELLARGTVAAFAGTLTQSGVIEASSVQVGADGEIILSAAGDVTLTADSNTTAPGGAIRVESGTAGTLATTWIEGDVDASATNGGSIDLLGPQVGIAGAARIAADGSASGGAVHVGGNQQGRGPLPNSTNTYIGADATISASSTDRGDGGEIIVFAQNYSNVNGALTARGGPETGDGGFIETSGLASLDVTRSPDAGAPSGASGEWLIDPINLSITSAATTLVDGLPTGPVFTPNTPGANLQNTTITTGLVTNSITVRTRGTTGAETGDITVTSGTVVDYNGIDVGPRELRFEAAGNIVVDGTITDSVPGGFDNVQLVFDADGEIVINGTVFGSVGIAFLTAPLVRLNGTLAAAGGGINEIRFNQPARLDGATTIMPSEGASGGSFNSSFQVDLNGFGLQILGSSSTAINLLGGIVDTGGGGSLTVSTANIVNLAAVTADIVNVSGLTSGSGNLRFNGPVNINQLLLGADGNVSYDLLAGGSIGGSVDFGGGSGNAITLGDDAADVLDIIGGFDATGGVVSLAGSVRSNGAPIVLQEVSLAADAVIDTTLGGAAPTGANVDALLGGTPAIDLGGFALTMDAGTGGAITLDDLDDPAGGMLEIARAASFEVLGPAFADTVLLRSNIQNSARFGGPVTLVDLTADAGPYALQLYGGGTITNTLNPVNFGGIELNDDSVDILDLQGGYANASTTTFLGGTVNTQGGNFTAVALLPIVGPLPTINTVGGTATFGAIIDAPCCATFNFNLGGGSLAIGGTYSTSGTPINIFGGVINAQASYFLDTTNAGTVPGGANITLSDFDGSSTSIKDFDAGTTGVFTAGNLDNVDTVNILAAAASVARITDGTASGTVSVSGGQSGAFDLGTGGDFATLNVNVQNDVSVSTTTDLAINSFFAGGNTDISSGNLLTLPASIDTDGAGTVLWRFAGGTTTVGQIIDSIGNDENVDLLFEANAGPVTFTGDIEANSVFARADGADQTAGNITATNLGYSQSSVGGLVNLVSAGNAFTNVGISNDGAAVNVVSATSVQLDSVNVGGRSGSGLSGSSIDITAPALTQTPGAIISAPGGGDVFLSGGTGGDFVLTEANLIGDVGINLAGNFQLISSLPLNLLGVVATGADFTAAGAITQAFPITVSDLTLDASGSVTLTDPGNDTDTLSTLGAGGTTFVDIDDLTVIQVEATNSSFTAGGLLTVQGQDIDALGPGELRFTSTGGDVLLAGAIFDSAPASPEAVEVTLDAFANALINASITDIDTLAVRAGSATQAASTTIRSNFAAFDHNGNGTGVFTFTDAGNDFGTVASQVAQLDLVDANSLTLAQVATSLLPTQQPLQNTGDTTITVSGDLNLPTTLNYDTGTPAIRTYTLNAATFTIGGAVVDSDASTGSEDALSLVLNAPTQDLAPLGININVANLTLNLLGFTSDADSSVFVSPTGTLDVQGGANGYDFSSGSHNAGTVTGNIIGDFTFFAGSMPAIADFTAANITLDGTGSLLQLGGTSIVTGTFTQTSPGAAPVNLFEAGNDFDTIAINNGSNVFIRDVDDLNVAIANGAIVTFDTDGLTQSGPITATTNLDINGGATQDVVLTNAANLFPQARATLANNLTLSGGGSWIVGDITANDVTLTADTGISQISSIIANNLGVTLTSTGSINLPTTSVNGFGASAPGGDITFGDTGAVTLGNLNALNTITLNVDSATQAPATAITGNVLLAVNGGTGGPIVLDGANDLDRISASVSGDLTVRDTVGPLVYDGVSAANLSIIARGFNGAASGTALVVPGLLNLQGGEDSDFLVDTSGVDVGTVTSTLQNGLQLFDANTVTVGDIRNQGSSQLAANGDITIAGLDFDTGTAAARSLGFDSASGSVNVIGAIFDSDTATGSEDPLSIAFGSLNGTNINAGVTVDSISIGRGSASDNAAGALTARELVLDNFGTDNFMLGAGSHDVDLMAAATDGTVVFNDIDDLTVQALPGRFPTPGARIGDGTLTAAGTLTANTLDFDQSGTNSYTLRLVSTGGDVNLIGDVIDTDSQTPDSVDLILSALAGNVSIDATVFGLAPVNNLLIQASTADDGATGALAMVPNFAFSGGDLTFDNIATHQAVNVALDANNVVYEDLGSPNFTALSIDGMPVAGFRVLDSAVVVAGSLIFAGADYDGVGTADWDFDATSGSLTVTGNITDSTGNDDQLNLLLTAAGNVQIDGNIVANDFAASGALVTDGSTGALTAARAGFIADDVQFDNAAAHDVDLLAIDTLNAATFDDVDDVTLTPLTLFASSVAALRNSADITAGGNITVNGFDYDGTGAPVFRFVSTGGNVELVGDVFDGVPGGDLATLVADASGGVNVNALLQVEDVLLQAQTGNINDSASGNIAGNRLALVSNDAILDSGLHNVNLLGADTRDLVFTDISDLTIDLVNVDGQAVPFIPFGNVDVTTAANLSIVAADYNDANGSLWRFQSLTGGISVGPVTDSVTATPDLLDLTLRAAGNVQFNGQVIANQLLIDAGSADDAGGSGQILANAAAFKGAGMFDFSFGIHDVAQLAVETGGLNYTDNSDLTVTALTIDGTAVAALRAAGRVDLTANIGPLNINGFDYDGTGNQTYRLASSGGINVNGAIADSNPASVDNLELVLQDVAFPTVTINQLVQVDKLLILADSANDGTSGQILANTLAFSQPGGIFIFDNVATHNVGALAVEADTVVYEDAAGVSIFGQTIDGFTVPGFRVGTRADIITGGGAGLGLPSIDVDGLGAPTYTFTTPSFITISQAITDSFTSSPDDLTLVLNAGGNIDLATVDAGLGIANFRLYVNTGGAFSDGPGGTLRANDFAFQGNALAFGAGPHEVANLALDFNSAFYRDATSVNFTPLTIDGNSVDAFRINGSQFNIDVVGALTPPGIDVDSTTAADIRFNADSIAVVNPVFDSNGGTFNDVNLLLDARGGFVNIDAPLSDLGGLYLAGTGAFQSQPIGASKLGVRNPSGMAVSLTDPGNDVDVLAVDSAAGLGFSFVDVDDLDIDSVSIGGEALPALRVGSDATITTGGTLTTNTIDYDGIGASSTYRFNVGGGQVLVNGDIFDSSPGIEMQTVNLNAAPGVDVIINATIDVDALLIQSSAIIDDATGGQVIANALALTGGGDFSFDNAGVHNAATLSVESNDIAFANVGPLNLAAQTIDGVNVAALLATGNVDLASTTDINVFDIDYDGLVNVTYSFTSTGGDVNFPGTNIFDSGTGTDILNLNVTAAGNVDISGANIIVENFSINAGSLSDVGSQFITVNNLDLSGGGLGDFVFDETSLSVAGDLTASLAGSSLVVDSFDTFNLGNVSADNVTFANVFGLTQNVGSGITANTLTIGIGDGDVFLTEANDVDNLAVTGGGSFSSVAYSDLDEVVILALAPTGDAAIDALDIDAAGGIFVNRLTLTGGTLTSPASFFGSNDVNELEASLAGALTFNDDNTVTLADINLGGQLSLVATAASQLPGSAINASAAVFNGGGAGDFVINQPGNNVDLLGGNAPASGLAFVDVDGVNITNSTFAFLDLTAPVITQTVSSAVASNLSLSGGTAGTVTFDNAGNDFDTVSASLAGDLVINDVDDVLLFDVTAGNVDINAGADISQAGATTINASALIANTPTNVLLPEANAVGAISGSANLYQVLNTAPGLVMDNLNVGTLDVDTPSAVQIVGNVIAPQAIITGGTAGDINLDGPGNDFGDLDAAVAGGLAISDVNALNINDISAATFTVVADSLLQNTATTLTAADLDLTGTGTGGFQLTEGIDVDTLTANVFTLALVDVDDLALANVNITGNLSLDAGSVTQLPATSVNVGAGTTLSGPGSFLLDQPGNDFDSIGGTVGGTIAIVDTNALILGTTSANDIQVNAGSLTQFGASSVLANNLVLSGGAQGDLNLPEPGNDVGTLQATSATGLVFTDANAVMLGDISAATFFVLGASQEARQQTGTSIVAPTASFSGGLSGDFVLTEANDFDSVDAMVGNALFIRDVDDVQLDNVSAGSVFSLQAGSATQVGGATIVAPQLQLRDGVAGPAFVLDGANDIDTLDAAINNAALVLTDIDDVMFTPLGGTTVTGDLTISATSVDSAAPLQTGALDLGGVTVSSVFDGLVTAASISSGANASRVELNGGASVSGNATFANTGGVLLDGSLLPVSAAAIASTASTTAFSGAINSVGNVTLADLDLLGNTTLTTSGDFTAAAINGNGFDLDAQLSGSTATLADVTALNLLALLADDVDVSGNLSANTLDIGAVNISTTIGGNTTVNALQTAANTASVALRGDVSVATATTFANSGGVQLGSSAANVASFTGGIDTGAGVLTLAGLLQSGAAPITLGAVTLADAAVIDAGNAPITATTITGTGSQSLDLNAAGNSITVDTLAGIDAAVAQADTLTINGGFNVNSLDVSLVALTVNAGTGSTGDLIQLGDIAGPGSITSTGNYAWNGGTLTGGSTTIDGNLDIVSANGQSLDAGHALLVNGVMRVSAALPVAINNGATITTSTGGRIDLQADADFQSLAGSGSINNAGTLSRTTSAGTATLGVALDNSGTVESTSGTLVIAGGGSATGTFRATAPGTLVFTDSVAPGPSLADGARLEGDGTLSVSGRGLDITAVASPVVLAAGSRLDVMNADIQGNGQLDVQGQVVVDGNSNVAASMTLASGSGGLLLSPNAALTTTSLTNNSLVSLSAGAPGDVSLLSAATFNNNAMLDVQLDATLTGNYVESASATLNQAGGNLTFDALGGAFAQSGDWTASGAGINIGNTSGATLNGALALTGTRLEIAANTSWGGPSISLASGASIDLLGNDLSVNGGIGQSLDGGSLNAGMIDVPTSSLTISNATVTATAINTGSGQTTYNDATIAATTNVAGVLLATGNTTTDDINVAGGATLNVDSAAGATLLDALTVTNDGTLALDGSNAGGLGTELIVDALVNNGQLLSRATGSAGLRTITAAAPAALANSGVIRTQGAPLTLVDMLPGATLTSTGDVIADGQPLTLDIADVTSSGSLQALTGGNLQLTGNLDQSGTISGAGSVTVTGTTTVTGATTVSAADLSAAQLDILANTLFTGSSVNVAGGMSIGAGALADLNAGSVTVGTLLDVGGDLTTAAGSSLTAGAVDVAGNLMHAGTLTTSGALRRLSGALVLADAATLTAGSVQLLSGTLDIGAATINTANLAVDGGSDNRITGNAVISGGVDVAADAALALVSGASAVNANFGSLDNAGSVTLDGGAASTGLTTATVTNAGTIGSAGSGGQRRIEVSSAGGFSNTGTVRAAGSALEIADNNSGGQIVNGGLLSADGVRFDVTAPMVISTGVLESINGGQLAINGSLDQSGTTQGNSRIDITGVTTLGGSGPTVIATPDFTVASLVVADGGEVRVQSNLVVTTSLDTGSGGLLALDPGGSVSLGGLLNNTGSTQIGAGTTFATLGSINSTGTLMVGGNLSVAGNLDVGGGMVMIDSADGVAVGGATNVNAGTLAVTDTVLDSTAFSVNGTASFAGSSGVMGSVAVATGGTLQLRDTFTATSITNAGTLGSAGTRVDLNVSSLSNTGTLALDAGNTLAVTGSVDLANGTVTAPATAATLAIGGQLLATAGTNMLAATTRADSLRVDPGATLAATRMLSLTGAADVRGAANLQALVTNGGNISVAGGELVTSSLDTLGTSASAGALQLTTGDFVATGTTRVGDLSANLSDVTLNGPTTATLITATGGTLSTSAELQASGLQLDGTANASFAAPVNVSGNIAVANASARFSNALTMLGLEINSDGTVSLFDSAVNGGITVNAGGTLNGTAQVSGNVANAGLFSVGNSFGVFDIDGDFTQSDTGVLVIEAGGMPPYLPGEDYDQLNISGTANLGGTLRLVEADNADPVALTTAELTPLTFASVSGEFASIDNQGSAGFGLEGTLGANGFVVRGSPESTADAVLEQAGEDPSENTVDTSQGLAELADEQQDLEGCDNDDADEPEALAENEHGVGCR